MIQIEIKDSQVVEMLSKLSSFSTTELLDDSAALLLNRIRTRFLAETDTDGKKWIQSEAAKKRRAKGGTGTLFDTGRLFHSIQAHKKGANGRAISTDVQYAKYHQFGTNKLPKREFLGFNQEDESLVVELIKKRLGV